MVAGNRLSKGCTSAKTIKPTKPVVADTGSVGVKIEAEKRLMRNDNSLGDGFTGAVIKPERIHTIG
jgi:hypothetical protein